MYKRFLGILLFMLVFSLSGVACGKKGADIAYPKLPATLEVGVSLPLEVTATSANLEFKWWTKYEQSDWVIVKNWGPDKTFSFVPDKPGIYAIQVDVKEKGKDKELEKKWLGQIKVTQKLDGQKH